MKTIVLTLVLAATAQAQTTRMTVIGAPGKRIPMYRTNAITSEIIAELTPGVELEALESSLGWSHVRLRDGVTGYVSTFDLAAIQPRPVPLYLPEPQPAPQPQQQQQPAPQRQPDFDTDDDDFPRAELFAGYSLAALDGDDVIDRQFFHGWGAQITGNFNPWLGVALMAAGQYGQVEEDLVINRTNVTVAADARVHGIFVAPEFSFRSPVGRFFTHVGGGLVHFNVSNPQASTSGITVIVDDFSENTTDPAAIAGAGMDFNVGDSVAIRAFQADYIIVFSDGEESHNFRVAAGVVFRF